MCILKATIVGPVNAELNSPSFLGIGHGPFGNKYFAGDLDEIRFYDRKLTTNEIQQLVNN